GARAGQPPEDGVRDVPAFDGKGTVMPPGTRTGAPTGRPGGLLAKPDRSLAGHTRDVVEAFVALFGRPGSPSALTACWSRFFRLAGEAAFLLHGLAAAVCHDWGKANDGFQRMLARLVAQLLRHEQLSALILNHPAVRGWLGGNPGLDLSL